MRPTVALDPDHWLSIKKLGSTSDTTGTETTTLQYSSLLRSDFIEQNTFLLWVDEQCSFALLQAHKSMDIFAAQYPYSLHIYIRWSFEALVGKSLTQFCSIILKMKYRKYGIFIFWSKLSNMKEVLSNIKCMCDLRVPVLLRFFIKRTFGLLIGRRAWEPFTTFYCFALSVIYTLECSCSSCKTVVKLFTQR